MLIVLVITYLNLEQVSDRPIKETNFMQSIDDIYASGAFCHLFINDLNLRIPDIFF